MARPQERIEAERLDNHTRALSKLHDKADENSRKLDTIQESVDIIKISVAVIVEHLDLRDAVATALEQANPKEEKPQPALGNEWESLTEYMVFSGEPCPREIRFPDGSVSQLARWYEILVSTAEWLHSTNKLTSDMMPIRSVANSEPKRRDGENMSLPVRIAEGIYVSKHGGGDQHRKSAIVLLKACKVDPASVALTADG